MGIRRSVYCVFTVCLGTYAFGSLLYILISASQQRTSSTLWSHSSSGILKSLNRYNYPPQVDKQFIYDPSAFRDDQPLSYTIDPPNLPYKMEVALPPFTNTTERQAAAFIVLVRNSELKGMLESMKDIEYRFNRKFNYPWIFLNDQPFTKQFKKLTTKAASSKTFYGLVDESMWGYPKWINQTLAAEERQKMKHVPYGLSESYRHMCRFQSGFFWRHPLVLSLNLEYYWRVEPNVRYYCELDYDPFLYMKQNNKKYGFNISFKEHSGTIPKLWHHVKNFAREATRQGKNYFPHKVTDTLFPFISRDNGKSYTGCHFWTNFEIARLDLWFTQAYQDFFEYLDNAGGFFYERWGDAPVHSIFAALYLKQDEIHFFNDIGYKHSFYQHCPAEENLLERCSCDPDKSLDFKDSMSCLIEYMEARDYNTAKDKRTVNEMLLK